MHLQIWTVLFFGFLLGFGAAMGVASFCMMSDYSTAIAAWLRRQAGKLERESVAAAPGLDPEPLNHGHEP